MSVTAIFIGHGDDMGTAKAIANLRTKQTMPPAEVIAMTCCTNPHFTEVVSDILVKDKHYDDWGQSKCDAAIHLATSDYLMFCAVDDDYDPHFIEKCLSATHMNRFELVLAGFTSTKFGLTVPESLPVEGRVTRGSFIVSREAAKRIGYNHRDYAADGKFVEDMAKHVEWTVVPELLHFHH
jgi:hypothetical protein